MNNCEIDVCKKPDSEILCRIRPEDFALTQCGVPQPPSQARHVDLYRTFFFTYVLVSGSLPLLDGKRTVDPHSDFYLHKVTPVIQPNATDYKLRLQWPSGRYSSNALQDVRTFNGAIAPNVIRIPAGRWVGVELDYGVPTNDNHNKNVVLAFEMVRRIYFR